MAYLERLATTATSPPSENHNHGAVVFGAVVGAVLGSALIGLAGYFMCTKRKSESFGHQRLYDDTRNDPGNEMLEQIELIVALIAFIYDRVELCKQPYYLHFQNTKQLFFLFS